MSSAEIKDCKIDCLQAHFAELISIGRMPVQRGKCKFSEWHCECDIKAQARRTKINIQVVEGEQ